MRSSLILFLLLLFTLASTPASIHAAEAKKNLRIGFVYVSPVTSEGFSYSHDIARRALEKKTGISTFFVDNIAEGVDAEQVMTKMAEKGTDIIIATSFGFMDATATVSRQFPDTTFLHCSGDKVGPNLSSFFGRIYQPRYLTGMTAGLMTKKNIIGYVAAYPIPEVIRGINAFTLGVQSVNPQAQVRVIWTRTWYDPLIEKSAAATIIEDGADVVTQHQDSPGVQQVAAEKGVYAIGYHSDMSHLGHGNHLVSAVWNWLPFYEQVTTQVREGTWKPGFFWLGMESGIVDISDFGEAVPERVRQQVLKRRQEIIDGEYIVFRGPVKDIVGKIVIPEGAVPTDDDLFSMSWFVKGVVQVEQ